MEANENSGERKIKRVKVRERERVGAVLLSQTLLIFPRSPAARRTDPLTEGLEQAIAGRVIILGDFSILNDVYSFTVWRLII